MGIFGFGKSKDDKSSSKPISATGKSFNIWQVVGVRNVFCEELYTCIGMHKNQQTTSVVWSDGTGYSHKSVDQVRFDILQSLREIEADRAEPIFEKGKVDSVSDEELLFQFPNLQKVMVKISLKKILQDYLKIIQLTRNKKVELEKAKTALSEEFGYDVEYAFMWRSKLLK